MRAGPELIDWKPKEIAWIETTNELIGIMAPWDAETDQNSQAVSVERNHHLVSWSIAEAAYATGTGVSRNSAYSATLHVTLFFVL